MSGHLCPRCRDVMVDRPHKWGDAMCVSCCAIEGLELMDRRLLEAERRGEERAWNAARLKFNGFDTYVELPDWRNSEEYKKGKAEVEG